MVIERTNNEVIIRLSPNVNMDDLQKIVNFARYKELTAKFAISQDQVNDIISDLKSNWNAKKKNATK